MTDEQIAQVEDFANAAVLKDVEVTSPKMSLEEATESGAIGLFEDEYRGKSEVRVVIVGPVSKELCGGTHVSRSGEIGLIKIVSEESIAAGTRRIRAITGDAVLEHLRQRDAFKHLMHELLGDDPAAGIGQLNSQIEALTSQLDEFVGDRLQTLSGEIAEMAIDLGNAKLVVSRADLPSDQLKELADRFAAALDDMGVARGDRVAIHLPNMPQFAIAYYGLLRLGAVFTPLSPLLSPGEVQHQLTDIGLEKLLADWKKLGGELS